MLLAMSPVPEELQKALLENQEAAAIFAALPPSHKKEYVDWISSAKQPETRARRAAKAVTMLLA